MEPKNFQQIFNVILPYLPSNWKKVALYFAFIGNMSSHKFYVDSGSGYIDCFQLDIEKIKLRQIFDEIEEILIQEREKLPQENLWSVFTMLVFSTGKFESNYIYDDITDNFIEFQKLWEQDKLQ